MEVGFQMRVLKNLNEEVEFMFRDYLHENVLNSKSRPTSSALKIGGYDKAFTPWWDKMTKLNPDRTKYNFFQEHAVLQPKGEGNEDKINNWFSNSSLKGTINSWLCGPHVSPSKHKDVSTIKNKVEDIPVPSIYDRKPITKGRRALKKERKAEREKTAGTKWFGMKAPELDEDLKNDMELIRMRGVLDPKRFYKNNDRKALPKYFQMGTVMDEGTDFFSSRLTKKQRKQTLVEELMADADIRQYNKKKYAELQQKMRKKSQGHKKFKKSVK